MKLQISLDDELVKRIDNAADQNYMSRSGFISQACLQMLTQTEMVNAVNRVSYALLKIAESNEVDEETKKQLDEFEIMARMMSGKGRSY